MRKKNHHKLGRICSSCAGPVCDESKTGMCRPCGVRARNVDAENRRRVAETLRRRCSKGGDLHARHRRSLEKARAARDPEGLVERGKVLAQLFPAHEEKRRAAHAAAMKATRHQWLPDEWRPLYQNMLRSGGFRAPQAKRIIMAHIAAEKRRAGHEDVDGYSDAAIGSQRLLAAIRQVHG